VDALSNVINTPAINIQKGMPEKPQKWS